MEAPDRPHRRARRGKQLMWLLGLLALAFYLATPGADTLEIWHTEKLDAEFTRDMVGKGVDDFPAYLALERDLCRQLDEKIYAKTERGPEQALNRYSAGSLADPRDQRPDWNRSFELPGTGRGGVLLLHGMSDSPYSLRALALELNRQGFHVIGLRAPGHGTIPSGLRFIAWQDLAAAVRLAMAHLESANGAAGGTTHIVGYSTGGSLALLYALDALDDPALRVPDSLVLVSPAIRVHAVAGMARFKDALSVIPRFRRMAWLGEISEFDPYRYNSFATNAGAQVHQLTLHVDRRIQHLARSPEEAKRFPPVLVFKSTVDFTVTTDAVIDKLLARLPANRHELVLFDINRQAAIAPALLVADPAPLTDRLLADPELPFTVAFVSNENPGSWSVVASRKPPFTLAPRDGRPLDAAWPQGVVSLSHVALAIPPDDPLYGRSPQPDQELVFLGDMALRGERGLLRLPEDWLLRMRYNPFYDYFEERAVDWMLTSGGPGTD